MYNEHESDQVMTLGDWILTLFLVAIPIVNLIMLLIWAFGSEANLNKKNFAKASLIFAALGLIIRLFATS